MNILINVVVFVAGALVMMLELAGSRLLAPYLGSTIVVWTSIIGVILGSLSFGYWLGGKLADRRPQPIVLGITLLLAGLAVGVLVYGNHFLLVAVSNTELDLRWQSLLAGTGLFVLPSILFGIVSPYAIKLKTHSLKDNGRVAGNLYALSTVGSILGTFLAGFWLIPFMGTHRLLSAIALTSLLLAAIVIVKAVGTRASRHLIWLVLLLPLIFRPSVISQAALLETDTLYSHAIIYDRTAGNDTTRYLLLGKGYNSARYLNKEDLVFAYTQKYDNAFAINPHIKTALMIGGGAFSYPQHLVNNHPDIKVDVVEIDPELTQLATEYFGLTESERLTIINEDARTYARHTQTKKYDAIFIDAYSAEHSIPFHLTTKEFLTDISTLLAPGGVVLSNVIGSLDFGKDKFMPAALTTYQAVYQNVALMPVRNKTSLGSQNMIIIASQADLPQNQDYAAITIPKQTKVLTDDFAPVEYYTQALID